MKRCASAVSPASSSALLRGEENLFAERIAGTRRDSDPSSRFVERSDALRAQIMSVGEIRVRGADPEADRDRILAVLGRNLPPAAVRDRYEWLYLDNPCGRASVWLAEDMKTGEAVGTSAGHPKRVWVNGALERSLNLSDFAIDRAYRSLGPALALLRATLAPMGRGDFAFSYDHPSEAMLALYRYMGGQAISRSQRWVYPLRVTPFLQRWWGDAWKARLLGGAADAALQAWDALRPKRRGVKVELLSGDVGAPFDRLDEELAGDAKVRLARSASYLSWRYLKSAPHKHEILCARRGERLAGYLVFRPAAADAIAVIDLVAPRAPEVRAALMGALVKLGRARGKSALWANVLTGSPAARVFPALGFRPRESGAGVVIYSPKVAKETSDTLQNPTHWWTLEGDQDV